MADVNITVTQLQLPSSGATATTPIAQSVITASDQFVCINDGKTFWEVENTAGGTVGLRIFTPGSFLGIAVADQTVTIPAGPASPVGSPSLLIGPFPTDSFNNTEGANAGKMTADIVSGTHANCKIRAFRF